MDDSNDVLESSPGAVACQLPLKDVILVLDVPELRDLCRLHHVKQDARYARQTLLNLLTDHICDDYCEFSTCILMPSTNDGNAALHDVEDPYMASSMKQLSIDDVRDLLTAHDLARTSTGFKVISIHRERPANVNPDQVILDNPPVALLAARSIISVIRSFGLFHGVQIPRKSREQCMDKLRSHICSEDCRPLYFVLQPLNAKELKQSLVYNDSLVPYVWRSVVSIDRVNYPPVPCTMRDVARAMGDYCRELTPHAIEETGCAVCGQLVKCKDLLPHDFTLEQVDILTDPYST
jgi:hypothetical protein